VAEELRNEYDYLMLDLPVVSLPVPRTHDDQNSYDAFMARENRPKNRAHNVMLYDCTRLVLEDAWTETHGDYIHASYVSGYERRNQYILCQCPFDDATDVDFWRMCLLPVSVSRTHACA
jgi:protein tyrosine phosphatase